MDFVQPRVWQRNTVAMQRRNFLHHVTSRSMGATRSVEPSKTNLTYRVKPISPDAAKVCLDNQFSLRIPLAVSGETQINSASLSVALQGVGEAGLYQTQPTIVEDKGGQDFAMKFFYVFGIGVFILAASASILTIVRNAKIKHDVTSVLGVATSVAEANQSSATNTYSAPSEEKPTDNDLAIYTVSNPNAPRILSIPQINVKSRVKIVGLTNDGAVDTPDNIYDTGWYDNSVLPGKPGSSLIVAHVSGHTGSGIFSNLNKLKTGSEISIERGDGSILNYKVTKAEQYKTNGVPMASILSSDSQSSELRLMTCAGKYEKQTDSYDQRLVVYASLQP